MRRLWQRYKGCRYHHVWFPDELPREFIPVSATCLRCTAQKMMLPTGECLGAHPIHEHYNDRGELVPHPTCPGPR